MKKTIVVSVIMALMLLMGSFLNLAQSQNPVNEEKETFYRLTPGVYVNGWPRFAIHFPKDWVERPTNLLRGAVFRVSPPGPANIPAFVVTLNTYPLPLDKFADLCVMTFRSSATDVSVVSDKPSQLGDGTPAQEVELTMVINGILRSMLALATKRGELWIMTTVESLSGRIGEDLKAIIYSIEFQPGKDEPVRVPPDIQEFLDRHCNDLISHDLAQLMTHYSDRYLNSGMRKGEMERWWRQLIGLVTSAEVRITEFVPAGDKVYLAGFGVSNFGKGPLYEASIIKENGEWKWYGNQRDVSP